MDTALYSRQWHYELLNASWHALNVGCVRSVPTQGTDVVGVLLKTNSINYVAFGMQMQSVHSAVRNYILYDLKELQD